MKQGRLYLIPTPIGEEAISTYLPQATIGILDCCDCFVVEEIRSARRFLKKAGITKAIDQLTFYILNEHTKSDEIADYLRPIFEGRNVGLMSEAGLPCVADPGFQLVAMAHRKNITVMPLVGPSSLMMALMSSGFNGQHFTFHGYLPIEKQERSRKLKDMETVASKHNSAQIFIEAPYRNNQLLAHILEVCHSNTMLGIYSEIMTAESFIATKTTAQWRKSPPDLHKKNTVFIIGN